MRRQLSVPILAVALGVFIMTGESAGQQNGQADANTTGSSPDDAVKTLNAQKDLVQAQKELIAVQKGLIDAMFPSFGEKFGKSGEAKIESGAGDTFHSTAKAAEALQTAAKQVCAAVAKAAGTQIPAANATRGEAATSADKTRVALLTDDDRRSLAAYRVAQGDARFLETVMRKAAESAKAAREALPLGLAVYGAGMLLSEIAEFTKLFRTDRSLFLSAPDLPEQLLVDLVAACPDLHVLLPAAGLDASFALDDSAFLGLVNTLRELRNKIAPEGENKDLIDRYDQFMTKLLAVDDTKSPMLFWVLRGEAAKKAVEAAQKRVLTVRLVTRGGTTMKTSSLWRSDRFLVSGGVIVSYRYAQGDRLVAADVITVDSGFSELSLKTP